MYRDVPSMTHYKFSFDPKNLWRCWDECKARCGLEARQEAVRTFNQENRWRKRGGALIPIKYGIAFCEGFLNQVGALQSTKVTRIYCSIYCILLCNLLMMGVCICVCAYIGCSSGPHLQGRFCSGEPWRNRDGPGHPHQDTAGL